MLIQFIVYCHVHHFLFNALIRVHGICLKMPVNVISEHMDHEITEVGLVGEDGQPVKCVKLIEFIDILGKSDMEDLGIKLF